MAARVSDTNRTPARSRLRSETSRQVIATLISTGMVLQPIAAGATPTGGTVVAGSATIDTSGNVTTVEQIDARVVIDWESFDIDADEAVRFQQPGTNSVALNRVFGELPTHIRGQLLANGHVWIVNRHGITFHAGSVVDTGGLLATTADIPNADFMAGSNRFTIPGEDGATVINNGSISFGDAGLAGLVAPGAQNNGRIAGRMGSVIVAGERTFAIDFAGDGMFAFEPLSAAGGGGRVSNTGTISNNGGYILIAARTASGMVDESISLGGLVEANTAEMRNGRIVLSAGDGLANVTGTLSATGGAGETGGSVQVSGGRVNLADGSRVDVSGGAGGGTAEIGGGYQGASMGAGLRNAQDTRVQAGATIAADAIDTGDGGTAVVWADGSTGYAGTITARGGAQSGNGGTVEVSGLETLGFYGAVDASAANGETGTLLLDPDNITVGLVGTDDGELGPDDRIDFGDSPVGLGNDMFISSGALNGSLAAVTLQADFDVTFSSAVDMNQNLTVEAGRNIAVNAPVDTNGSNLTLSASDDDANPPANPADVAAAQAGTIVFGGGGSLEGTDITLNGGTDDMEVGAVTASGVLDVTTGGALLQTAGTAVTVTGTSNLNATGAITLVGANDFQGNITADTASDNASISLTNGMGLTRLSIQSADAGTATMRGDVTLVGDTVRIIGVDAATLNVTATGIAATDGDIRDFGGAGLTINAADANLSAISDIELDKSHNFTGTVTASGVNVQLTDANSIDLGDIDATGNLDVDAGGAITQSLVLGDAIDVTGTSDLDAGMNDITLGQNINDFGGAVTATGRTITLDDDNALVVGTINAQDDGTVAGRVVLEAGTTLSQLVGTTITSTGTADLEAGDGITLGEANDFQRRVVANTSNADAAITLTNGPAGSRLVAGDIDAGTAADRGNVTLTGPSVRLQNIDAETLTVTATATDIDDSGGGAAGEAINAVDASLTASAGNVTLDEEQNDFTGIVDAAAINVTVEDVSAIVLGNVDATGDLDVTAGGAITQAVAGGAVAGDAINVTGGTDLDAGTAAITLDSALNDFDDDDGGVQRVNVTGGAVTLRDADSIELGAVDADSLTVTASGTGDITDLDGETIAVDGAASFTAAGGNIDLDSRDATPDTLHTFGGTVTLLAQRIVDFATAGSVSFGTITSTGIGVDNQISSTDAGATLSFTADVTTEATADLTFDVAGTSQQTGGSLTTNSLLAGGTFDFDNDAVRPATNDVNFFGSVGTATSLALADADGVQLGTITTTGALDIDAGGAITQVAATDLTIGGTTTLSGTSINLPEDNDFGGANDGATAVDAAAVTATATTGDLTLNDIDSIALGTIDANANLSVTALDGTFTVGEIGQVAGTTIDVVGTSTLRAATGITMDQATNNFRDTVGARATAPNANVSLRDADAIELGRVNARGNLTVTAGGAITQVAAGGGIGFDIDVDGTTDLNATGQAITLDSGDNDFTGAVDADGAVVQITDGNDLTLGAVNSNGGLTAIADGILTVGGNLTDTAGDITLTADQDNDGTNENIVLTGGTTLDAQGAGNTINLTTGGTGEVTGTGAGAITLLADGNLVLPAANLAAFNLTVSADGTITQTARILATNLDVTAEMGQDITLMNAANDFTGTVSASGGIVQINDTTDLTLGTITSNGGLTATADGILTAGGNITDTAGSITLTADQDNDGTNEDLVLAGGSTLDAQGVGSTLNLSTGGTGDITGSGSGTITLRADAALALPSVDLTTGDTPTSLDLTVSADGAVTQTGPILADDLDVTAESGQDITLANAGNDFTGEVALNGGVVAINDTSDLTLNAVTSDGGLTATSDGTLTVAQNLTDATGNISLTADNDADGTNESLVIEGGTTIDAAGTLTVATGGTGVLADDTTGGTITLNSGGAFDLPTTTFTDANLIIDAAGAITQTGTALLNDLTAITNGAAITLTQALNEIDTFTADSTNAGNAAAADVSVTDSGALTLGAVTAAGLTVQAGGAITDTVGAAISATGATDLTASDGGATRFDITLDNGLHDFNSDETFTGVLNDTPGAVGEALTFDGANVTLTDLDRLILGASTSTGNVTVTSNDLNLTGAVNVNGGAGTFTAFNIGAGSFGFGDQPGLTTTTDLGYRFTSTDAMNLTAGTLRFESDVAGSSLVSNNFNTGAGIGTLEIDVNEVLFTTADGIDRIFANLDIEANNFVVQGAMSSGTTGTLIVSGTTNIEVDPAGAITLNANGNDFQGDITASGAAVAFRDTNTMTLRDVNATTLEATAGTNLVLGDIDATTSLDATSINGSITDTDTDNENIVTPMATFSAAAGNVTLDNDPRNALRAHDFGTVNVTSALATVLNDLNTINLGNVTTDALQVLALGAISSSGTVAVTNNTILQTETADGSGTINVTGAFGGSVTLNTDADADGGRADATLTDTDTDLTLGNVTADDATITSEGDLGINGSAGVQAVSGTATYNADGGAINLSNAANAFDGTVNADADADGAGAVAGLVTLTDMDSIVLGDIDAGDLTVAALAGNIFDDGVAAGDVQVDDETSLTATGGNVRLDDANHDFGGSVDASGALVRLNDASGIELGAIAATTLIVDAVGDITDTGGAEIVDVAGDSDLNGANIELDGNHDFTGRVDAVGTTVTLNDVDALILGTVTATTLNATAVAGSITDSGATRAITAGTATLTASAGDVDIDSNDLHDFDTVSATGGSVTIDDIDGIELDDIDATNVAGTLDVDAGGTITQTAAVGAGLAVNAVGTTDLDAGANDITLGSALNDFTGAVSANGASVTLNDANDLQLADIDATTLSATSQTGSITDTDSEAIRTTTATFDAAVNVTLDNNPAATALNNFGTVNVTDALSTTIRDRNAVALGSVTTDTLNVEADGNITDVDAQAITVTGTTTLDAGNDDIVLDNSDTHDFSAGGGAFIATADDITVDDDSGIVLGRVIGDDVTLRAGGAVTQNDDATVAGDLDIDNAGADVTLTQSNAIDGVVDIDGANIALTNTQPTTTLGDIDASGNLTVIAGGALTDDDAGNAPGADVNVDGVTDLSASTTITLDDDGTNFDADGDGTGFVVASGTAITLVDEDSIILDDITTAALDVTANDGGNITDTATGVITGGDADLTAAGSIVLDGDHDLDTVIADAGTDITFNDVDALSLDGVTAGGAVDIDAGSLAVTENVTAGGAADLTTDAANGTTGDIAVDGDRTISAGGLLSINPAAGGVLTDGNGVGTINLVSGEGFVLPATSLTALSLDILTNGLGDDVTQTVGSTVLGTLDIRTSGGDVLLQQNNDLGTLRVDTTQNGQAAAAVRVTENDGDPADGLTLGTIVASDLEIAADGTIDDVAGMDAANAITASGTTTLTASSGGDIALDNMFHDFGGAVTVADAANVTLADVNDLLLAGISGNGTVNLTAKNDLTISGLIQTLNGDLNLTADGDADGNGSITVDAAGSIDAGTGAMTTSAAFRTILRNTTAGSLTVTDTNTLRFETGTTAIGGNVTVTARGSVTDAADSTLTVAGATSIDSDGRVTLDSVTNDFTGTVTVLPDATSVAITDAGDLSIGSIDSDGEILLDSGGTLLVFGDVNADDDRIVMTAADTVGIGADINAGTGRLTLTAETGDVGMVAGTTLTGGDLRVDAAVDAVLANTETDTVRVTAGENVETIGVLRANAGDATIDAGDDILLGDRSVISGTATLNAGTDGTGVIAADPGTEIVATELDATAADAITVAAIRADAVKLTTTSATGAGAGAVTFADGAVLVRNDLTVNSAGTVSDTGTGTLLVLGDSVLRATGQTVVLDNTTNDFRGTVRVLAETLELDDRNGLSIVDTEVTGSSDIFAAGNLSVGQSALGDATLVTDNSADLDDVSGGTVSLVADGPVDVARFDVSALDINTHDAIALSEGLATASIVLAGGGDVTIDTVQTSSLTALGMGNVSLDRVGSDTAAIQITANDIRLGRVVAASADLQAMAGSIRTVASTAGSQAQITGPNGNVRGLHVGDIAGTARLLDINGPLSVGATEEVRLTEAANGGTVVNNRLTNVIVDEEVAGSLIIDTATTIDVTSNSTVGSLVVRGEQGIRADVDAVVRAGNPDADGNARIVSSGTDRNVRLTGNVEGDARAVADGNALIDGTVDGTATAIADGNATIRGTVVVDAVAFAGNDASIDGTITGNATARAGNDASIGTNDPRDIDGASATFVGSHADARAATGNATIEGTIGQATTGDAVARGGRNATILGQVEGDATAVSGLDTSGDALISGSVKGNATADATAGSDAQITGTVLGTATAMADRNATIDGNTTNTLGPSIANVSGDVIVIAAQGDATITGNVGGSAFATAGDDAVIDGTIFNNARATGGRDASINGTIGGNATADAGRTASIGAARPTTVAGNATARTDRTTGLDATINSDVRGQARAEAGRDAIIDAVLINGAAIADAEGNARIDGTIEGSATATAGVDATIGGVRATIVERSATATATGGDASITGYVARNATVDASAGDAASITGYVGRTATATATGAATIIGDSRADAMETTMTGIGLDATVTSTGSDASILGPVGRHANATANNDATITNNGTVGSNATATGGDNATITGIVNGDATATALRGDAGIDGYIGGNATADASTGMAASITGYVAGDAAADAARDATITGASRSNGMGVTMSGVGGNASATADDNATITSTVGGNAEATAGTEATDVAAITGIVDGNATATARGGDADIDGYIGGNATADASAGDAATITGYVAGDATANAAGNATITGANRADRMGVTMSGVGGNASATAEDNATITSTVGGNAEATAGTEATDVAAITGIVDGNATATARGGDADIDGYIGGSATADASAGDAATITGYVAGDATANAAGNATITGASRADRMGVTMSGVGGNASATAEDNATITSTVGGNAEATAGTEATDVAAITGIVDGNATATAQGGDADIDGYIGGDATADASTGGAATITGYVAGNATADAGGDATITGASRADRMGVTMSGVGGNASATADDNATITSTVGGNADGTAGVNAAITGIVDGDATATAQGGDADIDGYIGGDATADASTGGAATITGYVAGNATADAGGDATITGASRTDRMGVTMSGVGADASATAGNNADINATVGGNATANAGNNAEIDGTVRGNAVVDAGSNITLARVSALQVDGTLTATAGGDIVQGSSTDGAINVVVAEDTSLVTINSTSGRIELNNADNDFQAALRLSDANTVEISDVGGFTLDGALSDNGGYVIADGGEWSLHTTDGRLLINTTIDADTATLGDLTLSGNEGTLVQIGDVLGGISRLGEVEINNAGDVVFNLRESVAVEAADLADPLRLEELQALADNQYVNANGGSDVFFAERLDISGVDGSTLILVPAQTEQVFDTRDEYFGLSILRPDGFSYTGIGTLDLFGELGLIRSSAAGLSANAQQNGRTRFNNCLVGDPNSCSALTQANVLRLVDLSPERVFVLDEDQIEQLFLSFGNEELWGLPSIFSTDISSEDDEDEDEDEADDATFSNETEGEQVSSLEGQ